jgi:oxalate decarboxylase/phosphoglucose isomerase-like protein (cupin superfamily)
MTNGERVRAKVVFKAGGALTLPHIHRYQDETMEILSGRLCYWIDAGQRFAEAGETVTLPRRIAHRHYAEGPEDTVAIVTMTPGLDSDYLFENFFGIGAERGYATGPSKLQTIVWYAKLKSGFASPYLPIWLQSVAAGVLTPILYLFEYRAVYKRFSGEEW